MISQIISAILMIINSLIFSSMNHPMNMGITLLIQTLMMSVMMGLMSYTSWFSYILFLVFLGGMLVLFIYMTSIASNEAFKKSMYFLTMFATGLILFLLMLLFSDPFIISLPVAEDIMHFQNPKNTLSSMYNPPASIITVFMFLYLLLTLVVVVFITKFNKGPLRPMD